MAKFPYGGFGGQESDCDPPWTKLWTVQTHLEDGEKVPPALARWLGEAIKRANGDPQALLIGLGLRKPKGRPASAWDHPHAKAALIRLWELTAETRDEAAIKQVQDEFSDEGGEIFSRSTLQRWLSEVRQAVDGTY